MCSHSSFCMTSWCRRRKKKLSGFLMGQTAQRSGKKNDVACHPRDFSLHRWKWDRDVAREMPKQLHLGCQCVMPTYKAWHGDGLKTDRNSHGDKEFRVWFGMEIVHLFQLSLLVPASLTFIINPFENSDSHVCDNNLSLGPGFQLLVLQFWKLSPEILMHKLVWSKNCRRNWNREQVQRIYFSFSTPNVSGA